MAHVFATGMGIVAQRGLLESRFEQHALVYSKDWMLCYVKEVQFTNSGFVYKLVQKKDGKVFRSGDWQKENEVYSVFG